MLQYEQLFPKNLGVIKKGHAHKQTMMRLFEFLTFYYSFLLLTVFFLKEAVHQRAFCSYIVIFLQRKILYNLFFFFSSQNNIWWNIIYTHYYSLYYDFQCQAQEIIHDQCVHFSVEHICSV